MSEVAWFYGGPLDGAEKCLLSPLPGTLTAWAHKHAQGIVEIGAGGHDRDPHSNRDRRLWQPHVYVRYGESDYLSAPSPVEPLDREQGE